MNRLISAILMSSYATICQATDAQEDTFIAQTKNLTSLNLVPTQLVGSIEGYYIPRFESPEENRNHYDNRPKEAVIKALIFHYTVINYQETLDVFTKNITKDRGSAHFVVTESEAESAIPGGKIVQVVPEEKRAWHAGVSKWRDLVNLNASSIGIENVNKGFTDSETGTRTWYPFDKDQINALGRLSQSIVKKYNIHPVYVVGHSDIAIGRKFDPGILFPWGELYDDYNVGAWLTPAELSVEGINTFSPKEDLPQGISVPFLSSYLQKYGYRIEPTGVADDQFKNALLAFKSHFSQNQHVEGYTAVADVNDMLWIWGLVSKYNL